MREKKMVYEGPSLDVVLLEMEDVLTASGTGSTGGKDENQGEWDPQTANLFH